MANGNRTGLLGGLATGLERGIRLGLLGQQLQEQRADRELQRDMAKLSAAFQVMNNKNLPPAAKVQAFNEGLLPVWNRLMTGPGSAVSDNLLLPLTEWVDPLEDYTRRAQKIFTDQTLNLQQKLDGMAMLLPEIEGDARLAPLVDRLKSQGEEQLQADTLRFVEMLTSDNAITDDEAVEAATIKKRSPKAVLEAATIVDQRRERRSAARPTTIDLAITATGPAGPARERARQALQLLRGPTANVILSASIRARTRAEESVPKFAPDRETKVRQLYEQILGDMLSVLEDSPEGLEGAGPGRLSPQSGGASSPDAVRQAVREGRMTREEGVRILKEQFGFRD